MGCIDSKMEKIPELTLFNSINQIAYVSDLKTHEILYVNNYCKELLGENPVGKKCYKVLQGVDSPCSFCTNEKILEQNGEPLEWEFHNPVLNKDFLVTDKIIEWIDGRKVRFEFAIDISKLKKHQRSLKENEKRLKLAQKAANIGTWDWNVKTNEIFWSDEIKEIYGLKEKSIEDKYKTFLNCVHPQDRHYVLDAIQSAVQNDEEYDIEHRIVFSDGSIRWVREKGDVIRDSKGKADRMLGITQDITDRKKMDEKIFTIYNKLEEESQRLKTILNNAPEAIVITDRDARIIFANKVAENLYNRPIPIGKEYQSHSSFRIRSTDGSKIKPEDLPLTRSALYGDVFKGEELSIQWPDGQNRHIIFNTAPIKNKDDEIIGAVGLFQDITDRKEIEDKIKSLNSFLMKQTAKLSSVNEELESFSYSVSHDLRSPLRSIDGFSQAILEDYEHQLDDEGKDYLHRIRNATQRMGELIDGLLKLSRITRHNLDYSNVNISKIAESIISSLKKKDPNRKIIIKIQNDLIVKADKHLLQIALENLINNAWKFTRHKKTAIIEIGKIEKEDEQVFFIKDNGTGFNMDYVDKLFVPFQRLHSRDTYEGTGIGLGIVKRVFNRHGGKIWAESSEGKGTTFYFTFNKDMEEKT